MKTASDLTRLVQTLEKLEATPGKLDKAKILQEIADSSYAETAKEFFSIAMDWFRIYGLAEKSLSKFEQITVEEIFGKDEPPPFAPLWEDFKRLVLKLENLKGSPDDDLKKKICAFLNMYDGTTRKWLRRAMLKSLTAGVSEKTVNKVWPGLIRFFEVQLADSLEDVSTLGLRDTKDKKQWATSYFLEPKLDGVRAICRVDKKNKTVKFLSRGGQPLYGTQPAGINDALLAAVDGDVVFDGELMSSNFNDTMKVVGREDESESDESLVKRLRFYVFDMMSGEEWDQQKCLDLYKARREKITFPDMPTDGSVPKSLIVKTTSHEIVDLETLANLNQMYLNAGLEGVMIKDPNGRYIFKRSKAWLKYKPVETHDFKIIGVTEGVKKKTAGKVASLVLELEDGKTCEVGSGLTDEMRSEFMKKPPIGIFAEIKFKMRTPDGLLREPILVRMRPDKKENT